MLTSKSKLPNSVLISSLLSFASPCAPPSCCGGASSHGTAALKSLFAAPAAAACRGSGPESRAETRRAQTP